MTHTYKYGYKALMLGYHDGKSFFALDFSLHGEAGKDGKYLLNTNPFCQRVNIKIENSKLKIGNGIAAAWLTDMMGRREGVKLTAIGDGHYTLDLAGRPQAIYLLTLLTADGQQHTIRLIKRNKQ